MEKVTIGLTGVARVVRALCLNVEPCGKVLGSSLSLPEPVECGMTLTCLRAGGRAEDGSARSRGGCMCTRVCVYVCLPLSYERNR